MGKGTLPPGRRRTGPIEMYDQGRFFVMTGDHFPGTPQAIAARQTEIETLHKELFPVIQSPQATGTALPSAVPCTDAEILDKMFQARNGEDVRRLWEGDISGYPSASEADLALCSHLTFWTGGDAARIDALFRRSSLYREGKWNRDDYRQRTIAKALAHGQYYDAGARTFPEKSGAPSRITVEVA